MSPARRYDLAAFGLLALPLLAGLVLWPQLPADLAVHWEGNTPDTFVSRPAAVFGLFALGAGTIALARLAPDAVTNTPGSTDAAVLFLGLVFAWVNGLVLVWNLGVRFDVVLGVLPVVALVAVLLVRPALLRPFG
jgi:hypothetical protein